MPASPARTAAFDILLHVERDNAYASELLHSPRQQRLSVADSALTTDLVMGVLRWRSLLDEDITKHASQPLKRLDREVLTALRLGAYQLRFLDRVPAHAAVDESVELTKHSRKRSAASLVNAVLRKLSTENNKPPDIREATAPPDLARLAAHPTWLVDRWVNRFGFEVAKKICSYNQSIPTTSVHLRAPELENDLRYEGISLEPGAIVTSVRRVTSGDVTTTASFRNGRVAIQDEASQLVALLVGEGKNILDCCAAPGGKTRILAERNPDARITAVELHPHRARLLRKLVPATNVEVIAQDIRKFKAGRPFDRVLVDAPCSGTGTLARNPEIKWRLQPEDLIDLQKRQTAILTAALVNLAPQGQVFYSTCSLEPEENEAVIAAALDQSDAYRRLNCRMQLDRLRESGDLALPDVNALLEGENLRTIPGRHSCDGFFAALIERKPD